MRPIGEDGRKGGHSIIDEPMPAYIADLEAVVHDESKLPHMYSAEEGARLFPVIDAAPEQPNVHDYIDDGRQQHDDLGNDSPRRRLREGSRRPWLDIIRERHPHAAAATWPT